MEQRCSKVAVFTAVLVLTACSEAPKPQAKTETETKQAGPAEPVTAKTAYWDMHKLAYSWTPDILLLSLVSKQVAGIKNDAGKAAMWTAVFASPGRHESRTFTYSIVDRLPEIRKGVDVARPVRWGGPSHEAMPFRTSDFAIDSDAAYNTALTMAGPWLKKHPDKDVSLTLGHAARFPAPVWYVLWGNDKSGYYALINATTGHTIKGNK